jgi:limonene-1,2-epoxide hydrolase
VVAVSEEAIERLRAGLAAFAAGDLEAAMSIWDADVIFAPAMLPLLGISEIRGRDALERFFRDDISAGWDAFHVDVEPVDDVRGALLVRSRYSGRIKGSEAPLEANYFTVYEYDDDVFTSMRDYEREEGAREAIAARRRR